MRVKLHDLKAPFDAEAIEPLRAGDRVRITGPLLTARCRVHKALLDGLPPPVKLDNAAIYHCGPIVVRDSSQWVVRAAGPSASILLDAYVPEFIARYRVRVLIGMGSLGETTRRACHRLGCVYLQTVGGAASKLADSIRSVQGVYFLKEFGSTDAMWALDAENLEAVVAIDAGGRSLHRRVRSASRRALAALLRGAEPR